MRETDKDSANSGQKKMYHTALQKVYALKPQLCYCLPTSSSLVRKNKRQCITPTILLPLWVVFFMFGKNVCYCLFFNSSARLTSCCAHYEKKILQGVFCFFSYFPENVVLQLLASCIHKQQMDATTFNSSLYSLFLHSRIFIFLSFLFFFFFLSFL